MSTIESVSTESRIFEPPREFVAQANVKKADFDALNAAAAKDFGGFWAKHARDEILWHKPFTKSLDESNAPFYKWFEDGELNVSYNCLDRNLSNGNAEKVAIIFEADDGAVTKVTYRELYHRVCRLANGLKSLGIKKGDRVLIYIPMSIEGVVAMQACARIGATHSVVFGGFSAKSLQERIIDAGAVAVITADEQARGGKHLPLEGDRRRGARHGRLREHPQRDHLPADRRQDRLQRAARPVAARARREAGGHLRARMGRRRASAVHPLHVRLDRQAEGCTAQLGRLPALGDADDALGVRHQADRRLLVHRGHRLGDRPHVHHLRTAGGGRDGGRVRRHPDLPRRGPLLAEHRETQGQHLLHGADGDPLADQGVRRDPAMCADELRSLEPAPARHGRRADQSRGVDVVPQERRPRAVPDRRHLVADGDRRAHDLAAAGRHGARARARARCRSRGSWPRSSTRPATTSRTATAAFSSSSARGRR